MSKNTTPGARRVVPRSRGALSGIALIALGLWGALIPFVGPYFNFSFTPDDAWHWTAARGWLEVLPGAVAAVAGFLLLMSRSRTVVLVAAWLGIAAGAWFVVGRDLESVLHLGSPGQPAGSGSTVRALEVIALFSGLGVVIVYFAATAFGRLSVVSLRDAHAAERREAEAAAAAERERQIAAARERDAAAEREREAAAAAAAHERVAAGRDAAPEQSTAPEQEAAPTREAAVQQAEPVQQQEPVQHRQDDPAREHRVHDHRALGALSGRDERPEQQPQVEQPRVDAQQGRSAETPGAHALAPEGTGPGYAQPQQYDTQHGYAPQPPADQPDSPPAEAEHESLGRRLFHRR